MERLMPNFSHGTAGIAYFLARLYEETHDKAFLDRLPEPQMMVVRLPPERTNSFGW